MPNRYIKETCVTSLTLTALSDSAERMFWRLTTVADDYGRFDANPAVVLGRCVPTLGWSLKKVEKCLQELCLIAPGDAVALVECYQVRGRIYGRLTNWSQHQRDRSKEKDPPKPKFPSPDDGSPLSPQPAADCGELRQFAALNESESENESENENENENGYRARPHSAADRSAPPQKVVTIKKLRSIRDDDGPTEKHIAFAQSLKIDPGPEWGKFKNYCLAHDKRYANFEAAFRNWLARSAEMKGERRVL